MPTRIADYYIELQCREGLDAVELIAEWTQPDVDAISARIQCESGRQYELLHQNPQS